MNRLPEPPDHELRAPLPEAEYRAIFQKVPWLTVEVVVCSELGVLLARRIGGPCDGLWNLPGGTVRFAEPLTHAVHRVALDEIGAEVAMDDFLGYIEYPRHARTTESRERIGARLSSTQGPVRRRASAGFGADAGGHRHTVTERT
jgi:hypothetical protein